MNSDASTQAAVVELSLAGYDIGQHTILKDLTLFADERRIGVVGRNGSGKSTFARLMCGLIEPTTGLVRVCGVNLANDRRAAIRMVGMLFQNPDHQIIFPTVLEEVVFGLKQLGMGSKAADQLALQSLAEFGKDTWADRSVASLSQGQRHLVCLIAVLAMQPRLIILDEPYAGLDIPTTMQLTRYIQGIDTSVIHISHDPGMLTDYDRVIWLDEGQIVCDGTPSSTLGAFTSRMREIGEGDALI